MSDEEIKQPTEHVDVEQISIDKELKDSYLAYSMSVIVGRALPDIRDGLKPVHRRILYAMSKIGCDRTTRKSARIVGDVIGKYHPHGDSAAYDALVRLAQDFNMRYMLVDGQGNFGSIDGDSAAAQRYTEAKLAKISEHVLCDLDKDTVDFVPNFDGAEVEPVVLATKVPLLLVNGSNGIAVGMATSIPPHNLSEICDGLIHVMQHPDATAKELMQFVKGPDFPTYGSIHGRKGILDAYTTGQGKVCVRAKVEEGKDHGHNALIVTEIPYQVNKKMMIKKICDLAKEKKVEGITEVRDESGRDGLKVVIQLKKDVPPQVVLNQLYKQSPLQTTFGIIMLAVVNNRPMVLPLRDVMSYFIEFRRDVVVRRTIYLLRKAKERAHILEGFRIALDNIDRVITIIRGSDDANEARDQLIAEFGFSEVQTKAILEMRLQRLTGMERNKILEELAELMKSIADYEDILKSKERIDNIITDEFREIKALYGDARRTEIIDDDVDLEDEDLIAESYCMVTRTQQNYIKRMPISEYQAQKRGGRGKSGMGTKDDDYVRDIFTASSHQLIQIFTTQGRVFAVKVFELPQGARAAKGKPIINLLPKLEPGEDVATILPLPKEGFSGYVVMVTAQGIIKRTPIEAFASLEKSRKKGLKAINFKEGDRLIATSIVHENDSILLVTRNGRSLHFSASKLRPMGRTACGVKGIKLRNGDEVVSMEVISEPDSMILTVTERGFGKRTSIEEHRMQGRGGSGIRAIYVKEKNGPVVGALVVNEDDHLLLATDHGTIIRTRVSEIRVTGRAATGVKLMNIAEDEHVVSIASFSDESDDDVELTSVPVDDSDNEEIDISDEELADDDNGDDNGDEPEDSPEE
ncbi:MAG: DNA gyrase subunit A [Proteobacteria bacterium]|nr:DNA gyrase subunit A [Pseudomonadota bacterium]